MTNLLLPHSRLLAPSPQAKGLLKLLYGNWGLQEQSGGRSDLSGFGNHLTDNNTVTGNPGPSGRLPLASQFTAATSESLSIADNVALSTGDIDFTLCGWIYFDTTPASYFGLVTRWHGSGVNQTEYIFYKTNLNPGVFEFAVSSTGADATVVTASTFGNVTTGTWYFVVCWHDSVLNTINIQVNNGAVDSVAYALGVFDSNAVFRLGGQELVPTNFLDGRMAGMGFWKRVLTAAERTYLYNRGQGRAFRGSQGFV